MSDQPLKVLLADDDEIVREALEARLVAVGYELVGSCHDGQEVLEHLRMCPAPDVVLLDIRMPRLDGIACGAKIKQRRPETRVVLLTNYDDEHMFSDALAAGLDGLLLKGDGLDSIVRSLGAAAPGTVIMSAKPVHRLAARRQPTAHTSLRLTEREKEVLRLLCHACSNAEIARQLFISESRVKAHVSSIMAQFGVDSRLKVVVTAYEWGLVEAPHAQR